MSFSSEVKKELLDVTDLKIEEQKALLYGLLLGSTEIVISSRGYKIIYRTTILNALKFVLPLLKKLYQINVEMRFKDEINLEKRRFYYLEITERADDIIHDFKLIPFMELKIDDELIDNEDKQSAFIRGLFIARGSINDPRKNSYHLEISTSKDNLLDLIEEILIKKDLTPKIVERRNQYVIYLKKSEEISNMLAFMKASSGVFYFEDQRIIRDVSNMANRMTNCDIANEIKCRTTCDKQLQAIKYLKENNYYDNMSSRLQTTARLREEYPDSSLEELSIYSSNIFGKQLSKSGISHCLKDLMNYYEYMKNTRKITNN